VEVEDVKEGEERSEAVHERDALEDGGAESMENGSTQVITFNTVRKGIQMG